MRFCTARNRNIDACGSQICLVYVITIVIPLNIFRARSEEKFLREQFGDAYQKYRAITYF